jgi:hypothetical protein
MLWYEGEIVLSEALDSCGQILNLGVQIVAIAIIIMLSLQRVSRFAPQFYRLKKKA